MHEENGFSNQDPEQQFNQAFAQWQQDYELDEDDYKVLHEDFWDDVHSPEAVPHVLYDLEELLRERHQKVQQYRAEIATFISQFHQLDSEFEDQLKQKRATLQDDLELSEKRTNPEFIVDRHRKKLKRYTKAIHDLAQQKQSLLFNEDDRAHLDRERQTLTPAVAQRIEQDLFDRKRQDYHSKLQSHIAQTGRVPNPEFVKALLTAHWLDESLVQDIHQTVLPSSHAPQLESGVVSVAISSGQVEGGSKQIATSESPDDQSIRSPLWMYSVVGAGVLFVVGLAATGLSRLPQLTSQAPPSPESATPFLSNQPASIVNDAVSKIHATVVATEKALLAQKSLTNQQLIGSIERLNQVPAGSPHRQEAQKLTGTACTQLQTNVFSLFNTGKLSDADAFVNKAMPCTDLKGKWGIAKQQWNQNEKSLTAANIAFDEGEWNKAITEANKVSNNKFQEQQASKIIGKAQAKFPPVPVSPSPVADSMPGNVVDPLPVEDPPPPVVEDPVPPPVQQAPPPTPQPPLCNPGAGVEC